MEGNCACVRRAGGFARPAASMFKRWIRVHPTQRPDGRWVPGLEVWEETASGRAEHARLLPAADVSVATEGEARAHGAELARRWLFHGAISPIPRAAG
jgi:hypothetical protein